MAGPVADRWSSCLEALDRIAPPMVVPINRVQKRFCSLASSPSSDLLFQEAVANYQNFDIAAHEATERLLACRLWVHPGH